MPANRPSWISYASLGVGIVCLGFSALFVRWAEAPGVVSSFYRMAIAAVVFAPFFLQRRQGKAPLDRRAVRLALLAGLFFGADMVFWSEGIMISGATNPTLMANTAPAWVGVGAFLLFRERLNGRFWLGLGLALAGAAVVLGVDSLRALQFGLGSLFGLIAGIFYGGFFLVAQRGRVNLDSVSFFWFSVLGSSLLLLAIAAARGVSLIDYPPRSFAFFLAAGLISQVVGWYAINYAQGYLPATVVSPTLLGQPVLTAVLAALLLGETFSAPQLAGAAAILGGILTVHRSRLLQAASLSGTMASLNDGKGA